MDIFLFDYTGLLINQSGAIMLPDDYHREIFDEIYDKIEFNTEKLIKHDPNFTIKKLESLLETEYNRSGNNWHVGGSVHEITINATIAAYENVLAKWKEGSL